MSAAPKPGWIYVLDPHVTIDGRPVVKIGYTTQSVEKRVRQLSTGAAAGMSILYRMHVDDVRRAEARLHGRFRSSRVSNGVNREFFAVDPARVIEEMDAIGAEVSCRIADQKYGDAMRAFKEAKGIAAVEAEFQREAVFLGWVAFLGNAAVNFAVYQHSTLAFTILFAIFLGAGTNKLYCWWHHGQKERRIEVPFRTVIVQEARRLDTVYPNTSVNTWLRKQEAQKGS